MKIIFELDTETQVMHPHCTAMDANELLAWLMNNLPDVMGTYYGRLARKFFPEKAEDVTRESMAFPASTAKALTEEDQ